MLSRFSFISAFVFRLGLFKAFIYVINLSYWKPVVFFYSFVCHRLLDKLKILNKYLGLEQHKIQQNRHITGKCASCAVTLKPFMLIHNLCYIIFVGDINYTTSSESENFSESLTGNNLTYSCVESFSQMYLCYIMYPSSFWLQYDFLKISNLWIK